MRSSLCVGTECACASCQADHDILTGNDFDCDDFYLLAVTAVKHQAMSDLNPGSGADHALQTICEDTTEEETHNTTDGAAQRDTGSTPDQPIQAQPRKDSQGKRRLQRQSRDASQTNVLVTDSGSDQSLTLPAVIGTFHSPSGEKAGEDMSNLGQQAPPSSRSASAVGGRQTGAGISEGLLERELCSANFADICSQLEVVALELGGGVGNDDGDCSDYGGEGGSEDIADEELARVLGEDDDERRWISLCSHVMLYGQSSCSVFALIRHLNNAPSTAS